MRHLPHVALLVETSRSYGRGVLRGIRRYLSEHGPWSVYLEIRAMDSRGPPWLRRWHGDGILTRTGSRVLADLVRAAGVPTVETRTTRFLPDVPFVGVDNHALGQRVAEHLLDRGFRRFGVYALDTEDYFRERCGNFVETVRRAGYPCAIYQASRLERPPHWEKHQDDLARWVSGLPKPVGLMACTDQLGFWLLDACRRAAVAVPEEVAVVGVENEESLCAVANPPLSSMRLNAEQAGYEAAAVLDGMMRGRKPPRQKTLLEPLGIVTRQSSDVVAIEDEELAAAVRFIREHACEGITVDDVLGAVAVSRSTLERGLRRVLGRSPNVEIRRVQLNRVQQLLIETDLPLSVVAARAGFRHLPYMCEAFKKQYGRPPGAYRAAAKA
jgi:LacI family transcriptional regulator